MPFPRIPPRLRALTTALLTVLILLAAGKTLLAHAQSAREQRLVQSLELLRGALRQHREDYGHYPARLGDLVSRRYLRQLPKDPLTDSHDTWHLAGTEDEGITDVFSSADGIGGNGTPYRNW